MSSITARGPRATVRRDRLSESPYLPWNAFIDLLSTARYEELTAVQRVAHLAFHYDREIQNGGHLRYFQHHGLERLAETAAALGRLEAVGQQAVLERAGSVWGRTAAPAQSLDPLDDQYHACRPDIPAWLEAWLAAHIDEFIVFDG